MKKIGIIGGLAWPSTADYYRLLCTKANDHFRRAGATPPYPTPPMVIESLDIAQMRGLRGQEGDDASWKAYEDVFRAAFVRLQNGGAEFGMIASNTPHMRLKGIQAGLELPLVSLLDTTASTIRAANARRALILGTPVTMKSSVYPEVLDRYGIAALPRLSDEEIAELERLIDVDLYQGSVGEARKRILEMSRTYVREPALDVVCLACTELPLAFPEYQDAALFQVDGITFVNATVAHAEAVVDEALT